MAEVSLEMLQAMLQRLLDDNAILRADVRELKQRTGVLERQVGALTGNEAEHYASLSVRLDGVGSRLERIERRLELVEAPSK
jgi:hypothetical protein